MRARTRVRLSQGREGRGKSATPRGRNHQAAPPRPSGGGARGPEGHPLPPPLRPKSGRRQTGETAAPHPPAEAAAPGGGGGTVAAASAPGEPPARSRPTRYRLTADRRRSGWRKRSGPFRGRPGEGGGTNQGEEITPPPSPPLAALTHWRPTGPRLTPTAAR